MYSWSQNKRFELIFSLYPVAIPVNLEIPITYLEIMEKIYDPSHGFRRWISKTVEVFWG